MTKLNTLIKKLRTDRGNSLAEFAVTAAMMATLATVAAPKFAGMGDTARRNQTMQNLNAIGKIANQFFQDTGSRESHTNDHAEGQGRLPGQESYDEGIGGYARLTTLYDAMADTGAIFDFKKWSDPNGAKWRSVFGMEFADTETYEYDFYDDEDVSKYGPTEWQDYMAEKGTAIKSPYAMGHYIYVVIPGGQAEIWQKSTNSWHFDDACNSCGPVLVIADAYNPSKFFMVKSFQ